MKVLLINGSTHEKGCTFTALSEVEKALNEEGIDTELVHIGNDPVRGCHACGGCAKKKGRCVFDDDMANRLIEKMESADGLVLGSPVYFSGVNGAFCALLDRMFYAGKPAFEYKPAACVVSARRAGTTETLNRLEKYPQINNMPLISSQYWNMVHGLKAEDVASDEEGLQTMRVLGRNMAWVLKCIEAGREKGIEHPKNDKKISTNFIR